MIRYFNRINFLPPNTTVLITLISKTQILKILFFSITLLFSVCIQAGHSNIHLHSKKSRTYFLDSSEGKDSNSGLSIKKPWKSLDRANQVSYQPGDKILFKRGGSWNGIFEPKGSGAEGNAIVVTAYGVGEKPVLDAQGAVSEGQIFSSTIRLFNQEYWEFRDIHVKNYAPQEGNNPTYKNGILVEGRDVGTLHGFAFINVLVSDVNGMLSDKGRLKGRENGGLKMLISRSADSSEWVPSNFDGALVDSCYFLNNSRSGFFTVSDWKMRDLNSRFGEKTVDGMINDWYPSHNIVVRNTRFEEIGGNGLVIRVTESPLVEHNLFIRCSALTTGNASYPYNCNNALWQFNEACYTIYEDGTPDASGFDSDYYCKNTIIQYNYSHDNEWGSLLITNNGSLSRTFNDGTIVRYNVFQDDDHHSIRVSGPATNTYIFNNILYIGDQLKNIDIIWHKSWGGWANGTHCFNNIIYNLGSGSNYTLGASVNNIFSSNICYGNPVFDEPRYSDKITSDPLLVNPGQGEMGFQSLDGYKVQKGSPAIDAGIDIIQNNTMDFFGNDVPSENAVDIGVHEFQKKTGMPGSDNAQEDVRLSLISSANLAILDINDEYIGEISMFFIDISGNIIKEESFSKNGTSISRVLNVKGLTRGNTSIKISCPAFEWTLNL